MGIKHNGYDFEKRLTAGLTETKQKAKDVLVGAVLEIFESSINETPVDDGTLRANWRFNADKVDTDYDASHTGNEGLEAGKELADKLVSGQIDFEYLSISNNLPYAPIVEYGEYPIPDEGETEKTRNGYSKLAPTGMFRRNLRRFDTIAKKHAARIKRHKR